MNSIKKYKFQVGGNIANDLYDMIDINQLRTDRDQVNAVAIAIATRLPPITPDYLQPFRQITTTGQHTCGIYISDTDTNKLIKCTTSAKEILCYLTIQKAINAGKLPINIIPELYAIHRSIDGKQYYITMGRETGSISDYVFEQYIPRILAREFEEKVKDIYNLMLPITGKKNSIQFNDMDIFYIPFIEISESDLQKIDTNLKQYAGENKQNNYSLVELMTVVSTTVDKPTYKKFTSSLVLIHNIKDTWNQLSMHDTLSGIHIDSYTLNNHFISNINKLKKNIKSLTDMFGESEDQNQYKNYIYFIESKLSKDLADKMRSVRYQVFLIDMYLLEECGMYQPDRKADNWLVNASSSPYRHLNIEPNQLNTMFDSNPLEYLYVKIGDPEQMDFIRQQDIEQTKNKIGKMYFQLGSKLGQYSFNDIGNKVMTDFFVKYFEETTSIDKSILEILSHDIRLNGLTDINGLQIYDLLKNNTTLL